MSKKITTIAMLAALSVSTLGAGVPTFADTTEYYYPPELVPIHAEYAEAMAECGTFIKKDNAYKNCYNRITNTFRERYGGLFESMYQLDYNGRMIITGLNPTAGTIRFYFDETRAFKNYPFTFENLVIFWADNTATVSPAWNEPAGWAFVDNYLATGEIPQGYHVLYNGKRGDVGWAPNTEMRATFGEDTTAKALIHNLPHKFIHVYGYDTEGNRHLENNYLNACINDDLAKGGECRLQYIYNGANANPVYINAESADEDKLAVNLKNALEAKEEAESRLAEAESRARLAEKAYEEALQRADIAELTISNLQDAVRQAEINLARAEELYGEAEARAVAAESQVSLMAESSAKELADVKSAVEDAKNSEKLALESEEKAKKEVEEALREIEKLKKAVEEANKLAEEAKKNLNDATIKIEALTKKPITTTVYKTIEKTISNAQAELENTPNLESVSNNQPEDYVEVPVLKDKEEHNFPWWIIIFTFSGIALILWWFIPVRKKHEN